METENEFLLNQLSRFIYFSLQRREKLFDELLQLNSQVWYTGVSKELFKSISEQTVFFEVKNNI